MALLQEEWTSNVQIPLTEQMPIHNNITQTALTFMQNRFQFLDERSRTSLKNLGDHQFGRIPFGRILREFSTITPI